MENISEFWQALKRSLENTLDQVVIFLPKILMALVILLIGWIIAKLVQKAFNKIFELVGVDRLAEKSGVGGFLLTSGISKPLSWIFSRILFWTVLLVTFLPISDVLKLKFFAELINDVIGFLPNVFVALVIVLVGTWASKVLSGMMRGSLVRLGSDYGDVMGTIVSLMVLIISFIIALSQLKIDSSILTSITLIIIGSLAVGITAAFAIGSKDIVRNILGGIYLNNAFSKGSHIKLDQIEGELQEIGTLASKIKIGKTKKVIVLPNSKFLGA